MLKAIVVLLYIEGIYFLLLSYIANNQLVSYIQFSYNFRYINYFVTIFAFRTFVLQLNSNTNEKIL